MHKEHNAEFELRRVLCGFFVPFVTCVLLSQCSPQNNLPPGDADNGGLILPESFEAVVVVDSLPSRARHIAVNDNGDIYVKARFPKLGGNVALRDTTGDGKADVIQPFGTYPNDGTYGTAMRIHNGYLYFSSQLVVYRQKLTPGRLVPDSEEEVILRDDHAHGNHEHIAKPLSFDGKGNMYVPFGAPSNACQVINRTPYSEGIDPCPLLEDHGGIWKFDANKKDQTQADGTRFATGLRSIVAMDWSKSDNNLYAVMHGRDDLLRLWAGKFSPWQSAELPSEEFLRIKEGSDAGWPYCYYDQIKERKVEAPEYGGDGESIGRCGDFEKPLIGFPGHWAPNDLLFYTGDQFPAHYKNGAFIAFHGSTNRAPYPQAGFFIAFVPFALGNVLSLPRFPIRRREFGNWEVFADGFAGVDPIVDVSDARFRPMGLAQGPDGSLYISDTEKGKIWRVMFKGRRSQFGDKQIVKINERKLASNMRRPDETADNLDIGADGRREATNGEKIYRTYCGSCHQNNGKGASGRFPPLAGTPWVTGDKARLIGLVLRGLEGRIEVNGEPFDGFMPQHSFLSDDEVAEVLTYVRRSFGNNASEVTAGEVSLLRARH
jgi:glucose/arabinose dehydrogenase/mono/diheme cytochrome c family protein